MGAATDSGSWWRGDPNRSCGAGVMRNYDDVASIILPCGQQYDAVHSDEDSEPNLPHRHPAVIWGAPAPLAQTHPAWGMSPLLFPPKNTENSVRELFGL